MKRIVSLLAILCVSIGYSQDNKDTSNFKKPYSIELMLNIGNYKSNYIISNHTSLIYSLNFGYEIKRVRPSLSFSYNHIEPQLLHNFSIETSFLVDVSSLKKTESGFGPYIQYCHYFQRNYSNIGRSAITVGWKFRFKKFLIGTQYSWIAMANEQILFGEEKTRNFSLNIGYQIAFRGKK